MINLQKSGAYKSTIKQNRREKKITMLIHFIFVIKVFHILLSSAMLIRSCCWISRLLRSSATLSNQSVFGLPLEFFQFGFHENNLFGHRPSFIRIICPNHDNRDLERRTLIGSISKRRHIFSLLSKSSHRILAIRRMKDMSFAASFFVSLFLSPIMFIPYNKQGLTVFV